MRQAFYFLVGLVILVSHASAIDLNVGAGGVDIDVQVNPPGPSGGSGTGVGVGVGVNPPSPAPSVGVGVQIDIDPNTPGIQPPPTPPPGAPPPPGNLPPGVKDTIISELSSLTQEDLLLLAQICVRVKANPNAYSAVKRAICELLAEQP